MAQKYREKMLAQQEGVNPESQEEGIEEEEFVSATEE
jgi:hypothetical protein